MSTEFIDGGSLEPRSPDLSRLPAIAGPVLEQATDILAAAHKRIAADQDGLTLEKQKIANELLTQARLERDIEGLKWYQSCWYGDGFTIERSLVECLDRIATAEAKVSELCKFNHLGDAQRSIRDILNDQDPTMGRLHQAKAEVEALIEFLANVICVLDRGLACSTPRRQGLLDLLRQRFNSAHDGLETLAWIENTGLVPFGEHRSVIIKMERRLHEAFDAIDAAELSGAMTNLRTALIYLDRAASNYVGLVYDQAERLDELNAG